MRKDNKQKNIKEYASKKKLHDKITEKRWQHGRGKNI